MGQATTLQDVVKFLNKEKADLDAIKHTLQESGRDNTKRYSILCAELQELRHIARSLGIELE